MNEDSINQDECTVDRSALDDYAYDMQSMG